MSTGSSYTWNIPVVLTGNGLQPQTPQSLNTQLIADATSLAPGLTVLPAGLIEDMSSTGTGGLLVCDSAKVELINSLSPYTANVYLLQQLAQIYLGQSQPGLPTNTSVLVQFSGTVDFTIVNGFLISDGTYTYQVQGGTVIGSGGTSPLVSAIAVTSGSWTVNANTVTQLITSVPSTYDVTVTNPSAGTPGGTAETWGSFRARVLQAGLAACTSGPRLIKTFIGAVLGASSNLISVQQASSGELRIVVGGSASTYSIAYAIFQAVGNPAILTGSAVNSDRNVTVSLTDYPDTYSILYVAGPVQTVTMTVTWNTTLSNFTGGASIPALVQTPLANYINALGIGQVINVLEMNEIFQQAVENVLDSSLLTRLVFTVYINSVETAPGTGTYAITGDPESSFSCATSGITVTQG